MSICRWGALAIALLLGTTARAQEDQKIAPPASMNEQVLRIPVDAQSSVRLEVTLLMPSGAGPFPLVIMNHGASPIHSGHQAERYRFSFSSYYFLSRGYAVALPMMRGFAGSDGLQIYNGCNQEEVGLANAKDIAAVIDALSARPDLDIRRTIVAGQSFGGWNSLAFGTLHHPKVVGLVNFVGGAVISNCRATAEVLAEAAGHFGRITGVPSIWFYGDNDSVFAPAVWRKMHQRYVANGASAELVAFGSFMNDSHNLLGFPEGLAIWAPKVDGFLRKLGLPARVTHPEYLPTPAPPPTHIAAIDDVDAVPYLTEEGRKTYLKYLSDPMPKTFVFSRDGLVASFSGGFDPLGRALAACAKAGRICQVYAVDNDVTWARPTKAPQPSGFANVEDSRAIPFLNDDGREGYRKYLTMRKPKAFAVAPDGGWSAASLGQDPLAVAVANCASKHAGCSLYAVDDFVVWRDVR